MDHAEAIERIELAAAEPDGLERLMAGDTPDAAAVAGHLAGCDACATELLAIRRTAVLAREVIGSEPDPALRERTLSFVRAVGRDRSAGTGPVGAPAQAPAVTHAPASVPSRWTGVPRWARVAAVAAAIVIAVGAGVAGGLAVRSGQDAATRAELAVLRETAHGAVRVGTQPDAARVALAATAAAPGAAGTVLYSGDSGELVMAATGLASPPEGMEYGCWLEVDGARRRIGRLYPGGDLQAWVGQVEGLDALPAGSVFGVSLVPVDGGGGAVVLEGATGT